jgi:tRNA CCA-adding enzyme
MNVKKVLKNLEILPEKKEVEYLKNETDKFLEILKREILKSKVDAEVFVGGSYAKGTIAKSNDYDVDVFVRFDWKYEDLSEELEKILKRIGKELNCEVERLHGSRDYFRIEKGEKLTFEVIPVLRIKKVHEERNVTDLSYFHVNYVRRHAKGEIKREIALAKRFCKAQGVYGAESYINGFSGYGLECLVIYYKSFEKMLRELAKVKERFVIDPEKRYKKKNDVFIELNESKIHSPIILIDPTWKERNVLAALNWETFLKFQSAAREFLKKPSERFFQVKDFDFNEMVKIAKKKKAEFAHVVLKTDRQEGDIAGTKMKKFSNFLYLEIEKYFDILDRAFVYSSGQKADFYLVVKSRKEVFRMGPPVKFEKEVKKFKARNKDTFVKNGILHSRMKVGFSLKEFIMKFSLRESDKIGDMGISRVDVL